jgi:hypothetical protein
MYDPTRNLSFDRTAFEAGTLPRDEHLWHCQRRALLMLDAGSLDTSFKGMMEDLIKHEELKTHTGIPLGMQFLMAGIMDRSQMVRWITGFN